MSYQTVNVLNELWNLFEEKIKNVLGSNDEHLSDIKKLMTAEFVIDLSMHEIYSHAEYVHTLTEQLLSLKNAHLETKNIKECCELWLNILKQRNQIPLKIKHDKKMDGECDFRFSLQLMSGQAHGFKEIQILDPQDKVELKKAIKSIDRLDCLAEGLSFAELPLVKNTVISTILEDKDVICLLAKDQSNQIIGHCWGLLLKNVTLHSGQKANVFWVMDLARDPDFFDANIKVGDEFRAKMVEVVKAKNICDFVGYQHILNHQFHMSIISNEKNDDEKIHFHNEDFTAKTHIKYDNSANLFFRTHIIKTSEKNCPYPDEKNIKSAVFKSLWQAAHSAKDFILGGIAFFARLEYKKLTHAMLDKPLDQRLVKQISNEQQMSDVNILKEIILSDKWTQQGKSIFGSHVPHTVHALQTLVRNDTFDFEAIKACVAKRGSHLLRGKLAEIFYNAISTAHSPSLVLDSLLTKKNTPKEWLDLITHERQLVLNAQPSAHR